MEPESINMERIAQKRPLLSRAFRLAKRYSIPLFILLLALCCLAFYALGRESVYSAHPELSGAEQANQILAKVGALIQLPNEQPSMATINDAASAKKNQPFLANAANGDVLIVFPNAQTALLYRPSSNKLIAVGPVTAQTAAPSAATQTPITPAAAPATTASSTSSKNATSTKSKS